jgi:hypothetical protein
LPFSLPTGGLVEADLAGLLGGIGAPPLYGGSFAGCFAAIIAPIINWDYAFYSSRIPTAHLSPDIA